MWWGGFPPRSSGLLGGFPAWKSNRELWFSCSPSRCCSDSARCASLGEGAAAGTHVLYSRRINEETTSAFSVSPVLFCIGTSLSSMIDFILLYSINYWQFFPVLEFNTHWTGSRTCRDKDLRDIGWSPYTVYARSGAFSQRGISSFAALAGAAGVRSIAELCLAGFRHRLLSLISCFAGGVFLATCLLEQLPVYLQSITEAFSSAGVTLQFPLPEFIMAMGFFLVLVLEQIILAFKDQPQMEESCALWLPNSGINSHRHGVSEQSGGSHFHVDLSSQSALRSFVLVFSLSLHSVLEGLAVGLQETCVARQEKKDERNSINPKTVPKLLQKLPRLCVSLIRLALDSSVICVQVCYHTFSYFPTFTSVTF
ncbi:uncharacterized protein LOC134862278 isoform X2 [Eleginops maclovinus]|uniref:uncharacterized protein LOC134862278 isoform X2 n=1 Tax=Eleginops maclovinus TaxID=56733 RepID=UPI00307FD2AB